MLKRILHTAQTVMTEPIEAEGTKLELKTVKAPFKGLHAYGRSTQETTTGKQLASDDSITLTEAWTKEGKVYIGYNSSYRPILVTISGDFKVGEAFTISCNVIQENVKYYMNIADANNAPNNNSGNTTLNKKGIASATFTLDADTDRLICSVSGASPTSGILRISDIMVNKGSSPLPWEPYTGGMPSSNPDYPQEIQSLGSGGSIDGKVLSGNVFDSSYRNANDVIWKSGCEVEENNGVFTLICTKTDMFV